MNYIFTLFIIFIVIQEAQNFLNEVHRNHKKKMMEQILKSNLPDGFNTLDEFLNSKINNEVKRKYILGCMYDFRWLGEDDRNQVIIPNNK